MNTEASYVLYTYKKNHWDMDSSYPEEKQALFEARMMFDEAAYVGIKVIREATSNADGKTQSKTIYQKIKKTDSKNAKQVVAAKTQVEEDSSISKFLNAPIARTLVILTLTLVVGAGLMVYFRAIARGM